MERQVIWVVHASPNTIPAPTRAAPREGFRSADVSGGQNAPGSAEDKDPNLTGDIRKAWPL